MTAIFKKFGQMTIILVVPFCLFLKSEESSTKNSPSLFVESIEISGNTKTSEIVLHSLLDFQVGDSVNKEQLDLNIRRVEESHFFKKVNVYTQPGNTRGNIAVFIELKERRWPYFQFKGGYSELDGWYLSPIGLRFDNIFGHGNLMGIEFFIGDRLSGLDISFMRPNLFKTNLDFKILLYSRTRQFVHYIENQKYFQQVQNGGLGFRINSKQGLLKYLWFDFISENYLTDDFIYHSDDRDNKIPPPDVLVPFLERKRIGRFITSLNLDTRDQAYYPTKGWWGSVSLNQVSTQLGAFANYNKWILDLRKYQEITFEWIFAFRAKGGWVNNDAPFYEKFYLGGPNSLRGYEDRSLNPLGYASRLVQGGIELRLPLTRKRFPRHFLTGILFYDIGQAWNEPDSFDLKKTNSSFGYGLRFNLPFIGLLRLDIAYPIPEYDLRFHLSLGHTF